MSWYPGDSRGSDLRPLQSVLQRVELLEPRWLQRRTLIDDGGGVLGVLTLRLTNMTGWRIHHF